MSGGGALRLSADYLPMSCRNDRDNTGLYAWRPY
jgi:hypothetical protein